MKYTGLFTTLSLIAVATTGAANPVQNLARDGAFIYPSATYRRLVSTGELEPDPQGELLVVKDGKAAHEATTIVTFDFDSVSSSLQGKTCKLLFGLGNGDVSTGSQTVDLFAYVDPPSSSEESASKREEPAMKWRDAQLGRIHVTAPGTADWIMSYYGLPEFECPTKGQQGMEIVGVNDAVTMRWDIGVTGPMVQVL